MTLFRKTPNTKTSLLRKSGLENSERLLLGRQKLDSTQRRRPATANPAVFSYYARGAAQNDVHTSRQRTGPLGALKRYKVRLGHLPSYVAFVAIGIALGYACMLQPNPRIVLLNTPDTVHRDSKTYQEEVQTIWKKSVLNRTKFTVPIATIRRDITIQFPELASVQIELPLLDRRPTVILSPARPALQLMSSNGSFYVDTSGKVMGRTPELTQNDLKNLPLIRDETGLSAAAGKIIIPGPQALFLRKLFAQLQAEGIATQSITLPPRAANEADVRVAGLQYYIKFSTDSDPRQAVGTYLAAKAKLDAGHVVPTEYIDVRVEEKVFYK